MKTNRLLIASLFFASCAAGTGDFDAGPDEPDPDLFCLAECSDDTGCAVEFVGDDETACSAQDDCTDFEACVDGLNGNSYCAVLGDSGFCTDASPALVSVNATRVSGGTVAVCGAADATCESGVCDGDAVVQPSCEDDGDCGGGSAFSCIEQP